jgi:hypothetical protein
MDGDGTDPSQELNGREALTAVFADLNRYNATTHFVGVAAIGAARVGIHERSDRQPICQFRR